MTGSNVEEILQLLTKPRQSTEMQDENTSQM